MESESEEDDDVSEEKKPKMSVSEMIKVGDGFVLQRGCFLALLVLFQVDFRAQHS